VVIDALTARKHVLIEPPLAMQVEGSGPDDRGRPQEANGFSWWRKASA
jgi:hypothetical protein